MQEKFRIGDHVKFIGNADFTFEIIATTETPHVAIDKTVIPVPTDAEYVLRMLDQKKKFEPYQYALKKDIAKI